MAATMPKGVELHIEVPKDLPITLQSSEEKDSPDGFDHNPMAMGVNIQVKKSGGSKTNNRYDEGDFDDCDNDRDDQEDYMNEFKQHVPSRNNAKASVRKSD